MVKRKDIAERKKKETINVSLLIDHDRRGRRFESRPGPDLFFFVVVFVVVLFFSGLCSSRLRPHSH